MIFHIIKAIILSGMMFFSLTYLGFNAVGAMIFSMVPLLLGVLNVFTAFAYGLTGFIFILACGSALIPDLQIKSQELLSWVTQQGVKSGKPVVLESSGHNKEKP